MWRPDGTLKHTLTRCCRRQRPLVCTCTRNAAKSGRAKGDHLEGEKVAATPCKGEKEVKGICFISANHCRQMRTTKAIGVWTLSVSPYIHVCGFGVLGFRRRACPLFSLSLLGIRPDHKACRKLYDQTSRNQRMAWKVIRLK